MREAARGSDPRCLSMNPINVLDTLSSADDFWYAPLTFGYLNYSRAGHPGRRSPSATSRGSAPVPNPPGRCSAGPD